MTDLEQIYMNMITELLESKPELQELKTKDESAYEEIYSLLEQAYVTSNFELYNLAMRKIRRYA